YLNRLFPLEGGLYQWARVGLGPFLGFLTAWNLWAYTIFVMAMFAVAIATNFTYVIGAVAAPWYTPAVSTLIVVGTTIIAVLGLRTSKWLQNVGGTAHLIAYGALIVVPFVAVQRGLLSDYHPLTAAAPAVTALSLNIFGKLALGALSGFEYVAILAGECR